MTKARLLGGAVSTGGILETGVITAINGGTGLTSAGPAGNVLTSDGTTWTSSVAAGGLTYVVKTVDYTAVDKQGVLTDTSDGAFTVTLPATPVTGAQVVVADSGGLWGTNNLTVARNGSTIAGLAEDLVLDIAGVSAQFVYDGATWEVYAQAGVAGGASLPSQTGNAGKYLQTDGTTVSWQEAASGGSVMLNSATVSANYAIPTGSNGFSVGPITVADGVSVSIASGQRWVIV
jgi:hypothetical protein